MIFSRACSWGWHPTQAPTRWSLRQAVRVVNQALEGLALEKAPDKTFIARIGLFAFHPQ